MSKFIRWFEEIDLADVPVVGGKNASLGEMIRNLKQLDLRVPNGFAITTKAYEELMEKDGIGVKIWEIIGGVDKDDTDGLSERGRAARRLIIEGGLPSKVAQEITAAYVALGDQYGTNPDVAVRSSATAEDLPEASFAGQQESYLNVRGIDALLDAVLKCFASLYTDRAIAYRIDQGVDHRQVKLSVGVQKMVRSDLATSGITFTVDPESGFSNVILVTSAYGLGENLVAGRVDPDEFLVFKPTLMAGKRSILRRKVGSKQHRLVYSSHESKTTDNLEVGAEERRRLSLTDDEVLQLARSAIAIEDHYSMRYGRISPMDIEWAQDGIDGQLYIVQARPETVHAGKNSHTLETYELKGTGKELLTGTAVGMKIGSGTARVMRCARELGAFQDGDVLVADMTDPDWEPVMKRASAIVTNRGGRTCHAAIVSRELGVPCIVGTEHATDVLNTGQEITVSCAQGETGIVLSGRVPFETVKVDLGTLPKTKTQVMLNLADPNKAFKLSKLPVAGVGLAREEFIIANHVGIHPLALARFDAIEDAATKDAVMKATRTYVRREDFYIERLAEGIAMIAAAFFPRPVILRLSDFKSNEYANLIGGAQFEPREENPMIGFRGASRYCDNAYRDAFDLECRAIEKVRTEIGLTNLKLMVPFCRTPEEGRRVIEELRVNGLEQGRDGLEIYVMCELPSNVFAVDEFADVFDGFSIGSNDLTQLILGLDRDSSYVSNLFDERHPAVKRAIAMAIKGARRSRLKIGICGQAPSDYPDFTRFLVELGIDSISLTEDAVIKAILSIAEAETMLAQKHVHTQWDSFVRRPLQPGTPVNRPQAQVFAP